MRRGAGGRRAALAPLEGKLEAAGLREPVEVLRDRLGRSRTSRRHRSRTCGSPRASSRRRSGCSRSISRSGPRTAGCPSSSRSLTLQQDRFARTIGFDRIGANEAARWSDASRTMYGRFIEGVRSWVAGMPAPPVEYALLAAEPEIPEDLGGWAAAFAYAAWGLSGNWDSELLRVHLAERLGPDAVTDLLPPLPSDPPNVAAGGLAGRLLDAIPRTRGAGFERLGRRGLADGERDVRCSRTTHTCSCSSPGPGSSCTCARPATRRAAWRSRSRPVSSSAITPHHAWGITNVTGDVQDLYEERLSDDGTASEFDGAWEPLVVHREQIARAREAIRSRSTSARRATARCSSSRPDRRRRRGFRAARARLRAPMDGDRRAPRTLDARRARERGGFESFREALRGISCPGQNVVYADVDGTIGYQLTGRYPIRRVRRRNGSRAGLDLRSRVGRLRALRPTSRGRRTPSAATWRRRTTEPTTTATRT